MLYYKVNTWCIHKSFICPQTTNDVDVVHIGRPVGQHFTHHDRSLLSCNAIGNARNFVPTCGRECEHVHGNVCSVSHASRLVGRRDARRHRHVLRIGCVHDLVGLHMAERPYYFLAPARSSKCWGLWMYGCRLRDNPTLSRSESAHRESQLCACNIVDLHTHYQRNRREHVRMEGVLRDSICMWCSRTDSHASTFVHSGCQRVYETNGHVQTI